ncbi:MAG: hypothetical protein E7E64_06995 [Clostridium celatum]|nr:hypothetical protein [Clostridium celatum]MDU2122269.1 hypothetical protein [Clostridium celatum]MDU4979212.1 hypothetical protein [Clostridium celatum]
MSSEKSNIEKYNNTDDDFNFIPLNIDSSLAPNSTKFPLQFNVDGVSVTKTSGTISLGFPNLNINPTPLPLTTNPITELAPLTPYPKNIPTLDSNTSLNGNINSTTNSNDYNNNYTNPNNNYNNNDNYMNSNNYNNINLEYPSEQDDNFLHSYNEAKVNERYSDDSVSILDILRNFDISVDFSSTESRKNNCTEDEVDELFALIEKDNPGILATMKTYRIPYPIAKLLIKKIIQISLDNCKR